jgi:chemotaxis signal transduction protein
LEWFAFKVADEYFAIEARHVYRVVEDARITPVPLAPPCHLGLIYYRGELFDVIDIVSLLREKRAGMKDNFRIILVKWSDKKLAMVPDGIVGLLWIEDGKDTDTVYAGGNFTARRVTPDYIWSTLLKPIYGPDKI